MWRSTLILSIASLWLFPAAAQEAPSVSSYRIGPGDKVQIRVDELEALDQELEIAEDGAITMSQLGKVDAEGLTADQLALRIRSQLESKGLRKATVEVSVTTRSSRPVSVLGAVNQPGIHHVPRRATLMEVILAAGLKENHGSEVLVRRRARNGLSDEVQIEVADLLLAGDPRVNIPIFAGDLIRIPPARELTVYFLGQLDTTGSQTFRGDQRVTLLRALVSQGGLSDTASNKILIRRQTPSGERQEIVANYRRILNGDDPDVELMDGDIITVKESFF